MITTLKKSYNISIVAIKFVRNEYVFYILIAKNYLYFIMFVTFLIFRDVK